MQGGQSALPLPARRRPCDHRPALRPRLREPTPLAPFRAPPPACCSLNRKEHPDWRGRVDQAISNLARCSVCGMALRFIFILTPWLFFRQIFVPCFDCYDFEAAATHEVRAGAGVHAPPHVPAVPVPSVPVPSVPHPPLDPTLSPFSTSPPGGT